MKARSGFILRNLVGETVLMPVNEEIKNFHGIGLMNKIAVFVWEQLQQDTTRDELLQKIVGHYDVDVQTAARDLDDLLQKFQESGLLEA